jgi:CPA1 family monovalent cation:H+ antiporter
MELFALFSVLITIAALFSYLNVRFLKLPSGISLMLMGIVAALAVIGIGRVSSRFSAIVVEELQLIDFSEFILGILLSFLLFAGSLHMHLADLKKAAKTITSFAVIGTILSTFLKSTSQLFSVYFLVR